MSKEVTSSARTEEFTKKLDDILSDWTTLTELTKRVRFPSVVFSISISRNDFLLQIIRLHTLNFISNRLKMETQYETIFFWI